MEVALTMVRLRWALTLATLRKSTWQTIGYVLGIVFGIGALVGVGALAWFLGGPVFDMAGHHIPAGWMYGVLHVAVMYGSTFAGFIILFIQLMLVGDGSTMAPHRFALYGIPDRKLQLGMLLGGLSGLPAICGTLALMLWSLAYRWMSVGMVVMQLIAAPLAIINDVAGQAGHFGIDDAGALETWQERVLPHRDDRVHCAVPAAEHHRQPRRFRQSV